MPNNQAEYLDKGIKAGVVLGALLAARGLIKGTRIASKGMYRRAKRIYRGVNHV